MRRISVYVPLVDEIQSAQPPAYLSCDWLGDALALGLILFPLSIYRKMEELQHGHPSR
jgi:hypothetical protein